MRKVGYIKKTLIVIGISLIVATGFYLLSPQVKSEFLYSSRIETQSHAFPMSDFSRYLAVKMPEALAQQDITLKLIVQLERPPIHDIEWGALKRKNNQMLKLQLLLQPASQNIDKQVLKSRTQKVLRNLQKQFSELQNFSHIYSKLNSLVQKYQGMVLLANDTSNWSNEDIELNLKLLEEINTYIVDAKQGLKFRLKPQKAAKQSVETYQKLLNQMSESVDAQSLQLKNVEGDDFLSKAIFTINKMIKYSPNVNIVDEKIEPSTSKNYIVDALSIALFTAGLLTLLLVIFEAARHLMRVE